MASIPHLILAALYLALPAYLANMAPVVVARARWLRSLARPIDDGYQLAGQPILGKHKTWRGFIMGSLVGAVAVLIQAWLYQYPAWREISYINYHSWRLLLVVMIGAGVGAMVGDAVKSFVKRRIGLKSGSSWPVADQLDFVIGYFIIILPFARLPFGLIALALLFTLILHPLTNILGYLLGMKKVWW